jgi:uncharacterized lipoprotein NlpE involved in copper resistance
MKKSIAAAALVLGLLVVGCNNDSAATPTPVVDAVESMAAEAQDAAASIAAEAEGAVESMAAEAEGAVESMLPDASPAA